MANLVFILYCFRVVAFICECTYSMNSHQELVLQVLMLGCS